jgi:ABC-type lipoprotein release transport system permease subunit
VGTYLPGTDHHAVDQHIKAEHGALPVEIARVHDVAWIPKALAVLLGSLALVAIGHALVTSVRRRRRDLAMLKTLGFQRREVRRSVAWQSTALAVIGLVAGIPLGILVGRFAWRAVANGLGVSHVTTTTVPWIALAIGVPIALVSVNLLALLPARAAARVNAADVLRSE